eukprot:CAMPEP_0116560518 /NCGR_PEP_ID=MMETSP0397-20121206/11042_1 /TAXON_ID=216820 /ORGANISM="Cyclophora tenuis, Strain ECT3854" /LENGTH=109 /DNA_ID=CAMNT_0004086499 /DNA_START=126 /DNA_END=455 /DNA_ORIENTATION=-
MTNVDGIYAPRDITEGEIIFTEHDMPNAELHRSTNNPNCHVVELEDGTSALVACRTIQSGEFFSVPESDNEEDEYDDEDDDDDDDDDDDADDCNEDNGDLQYEDEDEDS